LKVPDNFESFIKCICLKCPSHNKCMKLKVQKVFCAKGLSKCNIEKKGCICNSCPLATEYNLKSLYYCIYGAEE